nr:hypothetical protein [Anaerolineae bacterium]
ELFITGNDGDDTLIFNFTVPDKATLDTLSKQIAAAHPSMGSLTFNGQIFDWENFEHLENKVVLQGSKDAVVVTAGGKTLAVIDPSSAAIYCAAGKLVAVGLDNSKRAEWLFTVKSADLKSGLARATSSKAAIIVTQAAGQTLSALPSDTFKLTDSLGRYSLTFTGDTCT